MPFHCAVVLLGTAFVLTGAFHGNVWFDESYSVAIANHSFSEIWRIGSGDVHPVLFYWCLHVLNLVFGQNILAYRLFAVAGAVCSSLLGLFVVRRDFGWKAGLLFSALCLFLPYAAFIAAEIRMYSWATFCVSLCGLMAWRIACVLRAQRTAADRSGWFSAVGQAGWWRNARMWAGVPCRWWVVFFLASLCGAYLHYYGTLAAFLVNLFLLIFLVKHCTAQRRAGVKAAFLPLGIFIAGAVVQVGLYSPWLLVLAGQVGVVSTGTYWGQVEFPRTFVEWLMYPVYTSYIVFADKSGWQYVAVLCGCVVLALAALAVGLLQLVQNMRKRRDAKLAAGQVLPSRSEQLRSWVAESPNALPAIMGLALYFGVFAVALAASLAMGEMIVYYRYLSIAIGGLVLAVSLLVASIPNGKVVAALLVALLGAAAVSQTIFLQDAYSEENQEPLAWFQEQLAGYSNEAGEQVPVVSTDIGFEGVTAVTFPDVFQVYLNWQVGNWDLAYQAYSPTLVSTRSWDDELPGYTGKFIVLSQASSNCETSEIANLLDESNMEMVDTRTFYRPYERTWFTVSVMEKTS